MSVFKVYWTTQDGQNEGKEFGDVVEALSFSQERRKDSFFVVMASEIDGMVGQFVVSCQSDMTSFACDCDSGLDHGTPCIDLPASTLNTWKQFVVQIPLGEDVSTFKQMSLVHKVDNQPYTESVVIDSVFLSNDDDDSILITDEITNTVDTTVYHIVKMYKNRSDMTITMILDQPFTGTTNTYVTSKTPASAP